MAKKPAPRSSKLSVYLYVPNIIGYIRVLLNCLAFSLCLRNKIIFPILYFFSFVCDAVDGWCARRFNQVSTFGAVLDMVTDRISTACLLVVLSQLYNTFLAGKASHKDVKDSTNWLFRAYYGNRMFMAYCCVSCEVLYLILFYLAENQTETLADVLSSNLQKITLISFLIGTSLFGWATKQIINVIQMKTAADMCVLYDIDKKHKHWCLSMSLKPLPLPSSTEI